MTLYAVCPGSFATTTSDADADGEVVAELRYGWRYLEQAVSVWRIVDPERADQIAAVLQRVAIAAGDGEVRLYAEDLRDLTRLIPGVERALIAAGIVDDAWLVPADRLMALKQQVPGMDLETERSIANKTSALAEVIMNVLAATDWLARALAQGCFVALG